MGEIASKSFLFCPGQIDVSGLRVKQFQITKVNQGNYAKLIGTYFLLSKGYGTHLVLLISSNSTYFASNCCSGCIVALPKSVVEKHTPNTHC